MVEVAALVLKWGLVVVFGWGALLNLKDFEKPRTNSTPQVKAGVIALQAALAVAVAVLL